MGRSSEKLADSLACLQQLQESGRRVFRSSELTRTHRERLVRTGWLREALQGWLIASSPSTLPNDTTPWIASCWEFCAAYCTARFGKEWHLSPQQSILRQTGNTVIPRQIVVCTPRGANNAIHLPANVSLFDLKQGKIYDKADLVEQDSLRLLRMEVALTQVPALFFTRYPVEAQVALASVNSASDVLGRLLGDGRSEVAGRLVGAFRRVGRDSIADEILSVMQTNGYRVREMDPFHEEQKTPLLHHAPSPIEARLRTQWAALRESVMDEMPPPPGLPQDEATYLSSIDDAYRSDAYHSLSIEGYRVTESLVERVCANDWNPKENEDDMQTARAMAARGYWLAFQKVREAVEAAVAGENAGSLARAGHQDWYRNLFQPCVDAQLIPQQALAGYRNDAVFLRDSLHVPPRWEAVRDAMPTMFDLLEKEPEPAARAVLGHWMFGHIHPYPDGNGRSARFLMNVMLASGGYPWLVIRVENRHEYMAALETASVQQDIQPFARFIGERLERTMERARDGSVASANPSIQRADDPSKSLSP